MAAKIRFMDNDADRIKELNKLGQRYSGTETHVIPNLLAAVFFFSPNFLLLAPVIREQLYGIVMAYNFVMIFSLTSGMSMFKFQNGGRS